MEHCPVGFILLNSVGKAIGANAAVRKLTGPLDDLLDGPLHSLPDRPTSEAGAARTFAIEPATSPGTMAERVWTRPHPDESGYLCIWSRATEEVSSCRHLDRIRADFQRGLRLRNEMLANVTHELRTPLNAVIGYADLLLDEICGALNPRQSETIGYLRQAADGLLTLINDLLAASRIEAGRADLVLTRFRLDHLVEEILRELHPLYATKDVAVRADIAAHEPALQGDRGKCKQILVNLVSNAIKFTPQGRIDLRVFPTKTGDSDGFSISVADTGVGIPAEEIADVFDMFRQVNGHAAREHEGSGLGLYLSRQLAELLGGTISVESEPERGSVFTFTVPRQIDGATAVRSIRRGAQRASPYPAVDGRTKDDGRPLVLLIGSSPDAARIFGTILDTEGMRIERMPEGPDVVPAARRLAPTTLVLDIQTHPEAAWAIYHELKADPVLERVPLVFLTDSGDRIEGGEGDLPAVHEPLDRQEVARTIRRSSGSGGETPRLLVVDDEETMRTIVAEILRTEGYEVLQAACGLDALETAAKERPHLMLLDLGLPDISGWDVVRRLAEDPELASIQVLILTGTALSPQEAENLRRFTQGLITKDKFRARQLVDQIATVLRPPDASPPLCGSAANTGNIGLPSALPLSGAGCAPGGQNASDSDH